MDWIALASVISSGLIAALSIITNAVTKRGDRKHAMSLEFEKRGWETKSAALLSLIGKCKSIRSAVDPDQDNERNQAAIFRRFDKHYYDGLSSPELIAYAAKSVNEPVERLYRMMQQSRSVDALIYFHRLPDIIQEKEDAMDRQDVPAAATHRDHEVETLKLVGRTSGIDVASVESLCNTIIEQAQKDLRGALITPAGPAGQAQFTKRWITKRP